MSRVRFTLCLLAAGCPLLTTCAPPTEKPIRPGDLTLTLSWDPNPAQEQVTAYHIVKGRSPNASTPLTTVDGQTTHVQYDAHQLGLVLNDRICFRVKAENAQGFSDLSDAACTTITADDT
ncbi:MAG: fibronectin type III domain-containing protein [Gammaproteobacteria bacterium]